MSVCVQRSRCQCVCETDCKLCPSPSSAPMLCTYTCTCTCVYMYFIVTARVDKCVHNMKDVCTCIHYQIFCILNVIMGVPLYIYSGDLCTCTYRFKGLQKNLWLIYRLCPSQMTRSLLMTSSLYRHRTSLYSKAH